MSAQRMGRAPSRPVADAAVDRESAVPVTEVVFSPCPQGVATGPVRRFADGADVLGGTPVPTRILDVLRRRRGGGDPLPDKIAGPMGEQLGVDLSGVRVHNNAEAHDVSRSLQAHAFTLGTDIYFNRGAYRPSSVAGQRVLAHELAHVAQHADESATGSAPVVGRANDPAEAQADRMADTVLSRLHSAESGRMRVPLQTAESVDRMAVLRKLSVARVTAGARQPSTVAAPHAAGISVIRRQATFESMDAAWGEMTAAVDGLNMVSFIERLRRLGRVPDGGSGFTWKDFCTVIGTEQGKKFVTDKWRDKPGQAWGEDQTIQGQHEWIKTEAIPYVIRTVVLKHAGKFLDQWLSACDMLRIPTSNVLLTPTISATRIAEVNSAPTTFTMSGMGGFNGHVGALYKTREKPAKDPHKNAYSALTKGGAGGLHNPMHELLTTHLNDTKNDLQGFLGVISTYQSDKVWGGDIPDLQESAARQVRNDLRGGQTSTAPLYGSYQSTYTQSEGVSTVFTEAGSLYDVQQIAREGKVRNRGIMQNRVNALVQMIDQPSIALSSQWWTQIQQSAYVVDSAGKTTEDYDAEAGYDSMAVEPNPHAPHDPIGDDSEPDEEYTLSPERTSPPATAGPKPFDKKLLDDYGRARSDVQKQQEDKIQKINAEVNGLFATAYQAETAALKKRVDDAVGELQPTDPDRDSKLKSLHQQGAKDLKGIDEKYQAESRRHFDQYIDQKRLRDLELDAAHPQQITHAALESLLLKYLQDTDTLLDTYVADIKKTLDIV